MDFGAARRLMLFQLQHFQFPARRNPYIKNSLKPLLILYQSTEFRRHQPSYASAFTFFEIINSNIREAGIAELSSFKIAR